MSRHISIGALIVGAVLAVGSAGPASADANGNASCIGFEASGISPTGSSDEFPGGMAQLQAFLRDNVGVPTGAIVSAVAQEHLGSHEACDAGE
jgi:ABC-type phosphate/phosphonate transport system substrate-binding protein